MDVATLESKRTGTLLSILNDDVNQIERFLEDGVSQIIQIIVSYAARSAQGFAI